MKQRIYSVKDNVSGVFGSLIFCQNDATAIRTFNASYTQIGCDDKTINPFDYSLYFIGTFDNEYGVFETNDNGAVFVANFQPIISWVEQFNKLKGVNEDEEK